MRGLICWGAMAAMAALGLGTLQAQRETGKGFVSAIVSPTEFDLDGEHVLCDAKTRLTAEGSSLAATPCAGKLYVGEPVYLASFSRMKHGVLHAEEMSVLRPADAKESGMGILELPVPAHAPKAPVLLHADGRRITITPKSEVTLAPPLHSLDEVRPGAWVAYNGRMQPDGSVLASTISFQAAAIGEHEAKFIKKYGFTIEEPDYDAGKTGGIFRDKHKKPWTHAIADRAAQQRVQSIGMSLVPAWMTGLPADDPAYVHFRFCVTDHKPMPRETLGYPDGSVLIPKRTLDHIATDDGLRAVLAFNIAEVLEKQAYRMQLGTSTNLGVAQTASAVSNLIPIVGPGVGVISQIAIVNSLRRQADRVSLALLDRANVPVNSVPATWNALDHKGNAAARPLSGRSVDMLGLLGPYNLPAATGGGRDARQDAGEDAGHSPVLP